MVSSIKNNSFSEHVLDIMRFGLSKGFFSDVVITVPGNKKSLKCHKSILSHTCPLLRALFSDHESSDEPVHLVLSDLELDDVMAIMNIIYVGTVSLKSIQDAQRIKSAAENIFGISLSEEQILIISSKNVAVKNEPKVATKRPLLAKPIPLNSQNPLVFFMAPSPSIKSERFSENSGQKGNRENLLNSYQRAKMRCVDKFKCNICQKGFPLKCLLQRHTTTHIDQKPFNCRYCKKGFSAKGSFKHHMFMKHSEALELQSKPVENKNVQDAKEESDKETLTILPDDSKNVEVKLMELGGSIVHDSRDGQVGDPETKVSGHKVITVAPTSQRTGVIMAPSHRSNKNTEDMYYWLQ